MTYSIVAVDTSTGELGGAGTSCLGGADVHIIYRGVPGRGVVHAQAYYNEQGREHAARLLAQGSSAAEAMAAVTQPSFDRNVSIRQYGIVDAQGNAVGYTGSATTAFAGDQQAAFGNFAYSVQGNILTSARVLEQAATAFQNGGCDLPERLMRALSAGAEGEQGDSRCTPRGIPADSAFLQVERPGSTEGDHLALRVQSSGTSDPLPLLQAQLAQWRNEHPCPEPPAPDGTAGATSVSVAPSKEDGDEGGCGCHVVGAPAGAMVWALVGGLFVVRWRRRAASQLRPGLLPRDHARTPVPRGGDAELSAHEVHEGEQGRHHPNRGSVARAAAGQQP